MHLRSPSMPGEHPVFLNVNLIQFSFIIAIYPKYRKLKTDYCKGKKNPFMTCKSRLNQGTKNICLRKKITPNI